MGGDMLKSNHHSSRNRNDFNSTSQQWDVLSAEELSIHIQGCVSNNRQSQKKIYESFYGFAMAICDRYTNNYDDSIEILNDGFLKIFKEIHRYTPAYTDIIGSFRGWLRKIMVYTAIDHFRKNRKHKFNKDIDDGIVQLSAGGEDAVDMISYEEIIKAVQELSPAYKTVLNLFIVEGFTHEEIANQLGISIGTSKSNLAKARKQLQKILAEKSIIQITERHSAHPPPEKESHASYSA